MRITACWTSVVTVRVWEGERGWISGVGEDNSYERVAGTHTETIQYNRAIIVVSLIVTISRLVTHRPTTIHKHFTSKHFEQLPSQAKTRQHSSTTVR